MSWASGVLLPFLPRSPLHPDFGGSLWTLPVDIETGQGDNFGRTVLIGKDHSAVPAEERPPSNVFQVTIPSNGPDLYTLRWGLRIAVSRILPLFPKFIF